MDLHVGTSGYSYKEWKGPFYPDGLPSGEMLRYYGERLGAVEINNTFYRMPNTAVLESWAAQVPASFRFSIKASRKITHFKRLKNADDETGYLVSTLQALGDRLGVVLFQLPPNLKCDLDRLQAFADLLPEGLPSAFEFRHESWRDDAVREVLRSRGLALCHADTEEDPLDVEPVSTAGWGYLRLRRPTYTDEDLRRWAERIQDREWTKAFVFFKHEDAGAGPRMAARFLEIASG